MDTPIIRRVRGHGVPEHQRAPRQHGELHRDYNLLYRPPSYKSGSYCYENPGVQSYLHGQLCTKRRTPPIDRTPEVRTSSVE